jgi:hypothetical protein
MARIGERHNSASKNSYFNAIREKANHINGILLNDGSKRSCAETISFTLLWVILNLGIAFKEKLHLTIPVIGISSNSSAQSIREAWGQGDAGSLLDAALTWSKFQMLDMNTQGWIPALWTLGLSVLEVPLIWLEDIGIPIFFSLFFIGLVVWSISIALIWRYFSPKIGRLPILALLVLLPFSWDFRYMLRDFVFYSESISYGLLFLGLLNFSLQFSFQEKNTNFNSIISGVAIGLSIMFRHTSDLGLITLLMTSSVWLVFSAYSLRGKAKSKNLRKLSKSNRAHLEDERLKIVKLKALKSIWTFSFVALVVTVPWRLMRSVYAKKLTFELSTGSDYVPGALWSLPNSPKDLSWGWAGGNWACLMDTPLCAEVQKGIQNVELSNQYINLAIKTALNNPPLYLQIRLRSLLENWIPNFDFDLKIQNLIAFFFLLVPIVVLLLVFLVYKNDKFTPVILPWACFLMTHIAQLMIIHFESRYFISVRILAIGLVMNLMFLARKSRSRNMLC